MKFSAASNKIQKACIAAPAADCVGGGFCVAGGSMKTMPAKAETEKVSKADRTDKSDKAERKAERKAEIKAEKMADKADKADKKAEKTGKVGVAANGLRHVAIIMDGNGRWAKQRLMPRSVGHREGLKSIEKVCKAAKRHGVECLSFFAFSTENWRRPQKEVDSLMSLLKTRLPQLAKQLAAQNSRLVVSGDLTAFDSELRDIILQAQTITLQGGAQSGAQQNLSQSEGKTAQTVINICLNYGGRQEIVAAANRAVAAGKMVSEREFSRLLYTKDLPDPDLLIRTGGEKRISNFLLFQLAYVELYFCDKLWPDFGEDDFDAAVADFARRNRRFGGI